MCPSLDSIKPQDPFFCSNKTILGVVMDSTFFQPSSCDKILTQNSSRIASPGIDQLKSRDEYFQMMRNISRKVSPIMLEIVRSFDFGCDELAEVIHTATIKRSGFRTNKLRPFVLLLSAGCINEEEETFGLVQIAALIELLNIATYLENLSLDRKGECKSGELSSFTLAADVLISAIHERISDISTLSKSITNQVHALFAKSYREVAQGQYVDLHKIPRLGSQQASLIEAREYLNLYVKRCRFLGGSSLGSACAIGATLGSASLYDFEKLQRFGYYHGLALQVINDISDFTPITSASKSVGKDKFDRYADIRNHRLTLPLYIAYKLSKSSDQEYLDSLLKSATHVTLDDTYLADILRNTKALDYAYSLAKYADQKASEALDGMHGDQVSYLRSSLSISHDNGRYKYIREIMKIPLSFVSKSEHRMGEDFLRFLEDNWLSVK
jgi:geranylgeranyl pyrophosphate synthase